MKEYKKPEMSIKTLVQDTKLATDNGIEDGEIAASAHTWWPDFAQ